MLCSTHKLAQSWVRSFATFAIALGATVQPSFAGPIVSEEALSQKGNSVYFTNNPISDKVFARINGKSWKAICRHDRKDFRYLRVLHHDGHGHIRHGELIVHKSVAKDVIEVFEALYTQGYPIERMVLIDAYGADDERSMMANNTSAFNCRVVKESQALGSCARHGD